MLQVTVSAAILVIVVVVKLAMPDVLNRCRTQLLALMGEDTDFVAAFSAVGRAVSGDGSVGSALNDAYTAVFGPSHADDPAEEPANDPAQTGAEEETPPAEDGAPVYSAANTPAQVCLLQQQLGFAYAAARGRGGDVRLRSAHAPARRRGALSLRAGHRSGGGERRHELRRRDNHGRRQQRPTSVNTSWSRTRTAILRSMPTGSRVTASSGRRWRWATRSPRWGRPVRRPGSHLHFELHQDTVYLNPIYYVQL